MAEQDSGVKRLKSLFRLRPGAPLPDELQEWPRVVFLGSVIGFVFGGLMGARLAGDKYIAMNHNTKYPHPMQAHRELHGAAMLGFVRHGSKWGWKIGMFAGIFSGCNILLSVYRDKESPLNMMAAGGVSGTLFRIRDGIKPAVGGCVLGVLLSIPVSCLYHGLYWLLVSEEEKLKIRQTRLIARQKRDMEWYGLTIIHCYIVQQ
jgi:hypothetical protein